ncbi:uncharacterized protein LOC144089734 [Stigmatopora argus]
MRLPQQMQKMSYFHRGILCHPEHRGMRFYPRSEGPTVLCAASVENQEVADSSQDRRDELGAPEISHRGGRTKMAGKKPIAVSSTAVIPSGLTPRGRKTADTRRSRANAMARLETSKGDGGPGIFTADSRLRSKTLILRSQKCGPWAGNGPLGGPDPARKCFSTKTNPPRNTLVAYEGLEGFAGTGSDTPRP